MCFHGTQLSVNSLMALQQIIVFCSDKGLFWGKMRKLSQTRKHFNSFYANKHCAGIQATHKYTAQTATHTFTLSAVVTAFQQVERKWLRLSFNNRLANLLLVSLEFSSIFWYLLFPFCLSKQWL